jgi:tetratricopeptide (TPR) repeat protein
MRQGERARARALLEQGLALAEAAGHAPTLALALHNLGYLALNTKDYPAAAALLERSLGIWRWLGNRHKTSLTLRHLGEAAREHGDLDRAQMYFEEAVVACREQGALGHLAYVLFELGSVLYQRKAYDQAQPLYAESLELAAHCGLDYALGYTGNMLASTLFHLGEPVRARQLHQQALRFYAESQDEEGITWTLERLAVLEAMYGDAPTAARLLGAASAAREALGIPRSRWDQVDWDRAAATARAALGESLFARTFETGRALSRQRAIEQALDSVSLQRG